MTFVDAIRNGVSKHESSILAFSHLVADNPEPAFEEYQAASGLAELLAASGFSVESKVGGLPTAVRGSIGTGPLTVAFLAEYDALPGIGHACGHNVIAAASAGAALALIPTVDDLGLRVIVLGTPAEESGGGKILLLEQGSFAGVHAALMVHPGPKDLIVMPTLATTQVDVRYAGVAAHSSAFPELGVNAGDALTVAQVAIGLLRQHLSPDQRVHGIVTKGGEAPNVVPADTAMRYIIRAATVGQLQELEQRVRRCFEAGAIGTGCEVAIERTMPIYTELSSDPDLHHRYRVRAQELGRDARDPSPRAMRAAGATDAGNVSQIIPTIHPMIGIDSLPAVPHQAEFAAIARGSSGDRAVLDGATALALTAADAASDPALRVRLLRVEETPD